jgi:hypothetical protein
VPHRSGSFVSRDENEIFRDRSDRQWHPRADAPSFDWDQRQKPKVSVQGELKAGLVKSETLREQTYERGGLDTERQEHIP